MRKGIFGKLAVTNIRKHKSTYIPYMFTCIICIAMLYMMFFIEGNDGLNSMVGSGTVSLILRLGITVVGIFSVIFLLYCNSYVMKRRQKELGLYNILGLEKGHIARMMLVETVLTSLVSLILGLAVGILGSKLALLLLLKLLAIPAQFGFYISGTGIRICCVIFGGIFFLTLVNNLRRVHLSRPIELLRGGSVGEREPRAKWLIALIGFVCLGAGYYIAVTTTSPLEALVLFFLAVILVMIGTYLLFTAGSIVVLKIMRWNKRFYYKTSNFTSVSGMLYRMKQNAVGLANICILSTGVLLMLSTTVSLNFGIKDIVQNNYPQDVYITLHSQNLEEAGQVVEALESELDKRQLPVTEKVVYSYLSMACIEEEEGSYVFRRPKNMAEIQYDTLVVVPEKEYARLTGETPGLTEGEALIYRQKGALLDSFTVQDEVYKIVENLKEWPIPGDPDPYMQNNNTAIVVTEKDFEKIDGLQREAYQDGYCSTPTTSFGIDLEGSAEEKRSYGNEMRQYMEDYGENESFSEDFWYLFHIQEEEYDNVRMLYGGFLFIGIFLGGLFLVGTAMIIYYKQMSEGYEDKGRYEIMRKVGMSRREVKSSIRRQILMIFFLPLLVAVVHITMAFPLLERLLAMFMLKNTPLFVICMLVTILIFAVVYAVIYILTARSYYRILEQAE